MPNFQAMVKTGDYIMALVDTFFIEFVYIKTYIVELSSTNILIGHLCICDIP